jgi:hypothetical protein
MLNITLTLTAAPELLAAISNITSALRYQNTENVKGDGFNYTSSKIEAEYNFQQGGVSSIQPQNQGQTDIFQPKLK